MTTRLVIEYISNDILDNITKFENYSKYENTKSDSGFDIYMPQKTIVPNGTFSNKLKFGIKAAMYLDDKPIGYMLLPRSSTGSKTPLRLSNSVGIIDSGYRGELMAVVDNTSEKEYIFNQGDRLFQLVPFHGRGVDEVIIGKVDETIRGEGGFGSSGV